MWRNWSSACTMIRKIWKNPRQKQKLCDIKLFGSLKVVLNDKRAKWLNKACFIFGQRTRYNHLIVREWLFWIFCITNINASDSVQASEISALSTVLSLMHLNVFCNMRNCLNYFRHGKTKFIYSGFSPFKNTCNIWNTCTHLLWLHFPRLSCSLQMLSYMKKKYVVSFSCLVWIYVHVK